MSLKDSMADQTRFVSLAFRKTIAAGIVAFAFVGVWSAGVRGAKRQSAKVDAALRQVMQTSGSAAVSVIVTARGNRQELAQKVQTRGVSVYSDHPSIGAFAASVGPEDLAWLANDPNVDTLSLDAVVTPTGDAAAPASPPDSALVNTLGLDDVSFTGNGIGIAVIDSGLERNPDFDKSRIDSYDFTANGGTVEPYDDYGHGTHVSGLIAGSGVLSRVKINVANGNGAVRRVEKPLYRGVAPDARIVSLKVLDATGGGVTSRVIQAIEFAVANRQQLGIDIINLSLGHPIYEPASTDPLVRAVEDAVHAGLVVVVAAGNQGTNVQTGLPGYAGITSPGNAPSAITVGAVDTQNTATRLDDTVAWYSSRGPTWFDAYAKPDIVAPGHALISDAAVHGALYQQLLTKRVWTPGTKHAQYLQLSGTSMATAVTSGVVARMLEAHKSRFQTPLTPNAVKAFLEFSALPIPGADMLTQGNGSLNGAGAVALALAADTSVPSGTWWLANGVAPATTIADVSLPWSQTIVWGSTLLSGSSVYYNQPGWAQTIVWGSTAVWGTTIVWGSNVVWDLDPTTWSSTIVWGSGLIGTTDGTTIVWGSAHVSPSTIVWGSLSTAPKP
jgi:serine protease AprX